MPPRCPCLLLTHGSLMLDNEQRATPYSNDEFKEKDDLEHDTHIYKAHIKYRNAFQIQKKQ